MKHTPLPTGNPGGFTDKFTVTYADLVQSSGDATVSDPLVLITSLAAGWIIQRCAYRLKTGFDASDASINSLTMAVGITGAIDDLMLAASTQLAVDGTEINYFEESPAAVGVVLPKAIAAAVNVIATFTVAGGANPTIDELNAGEVEIYITRYYMPELGEV